MVKNHDFPIRTSPSPIVETGTTSSQLRYDLGIPFSEVRKEPIIPIPVSGKIRVRFKKAAPLQNIPVEDDNGFI